MERFSVPNAKLANSMSDNAFSVVCNRCGYALTPTEFFQIGKAMAWCPQCSHLFQYKAQASGEDQDQDVPPSPDALSTMRTFRAASMVEPPQNVTRGPGSFTPPPENAPPMNKTPPPSPSSPTPPPPPRVPSSTPSPPGSTPITPSSQQYRPEYPVVAGYTILGELGSGGMGKVYRARHEKLKRLVALKMIWFSADESMNYLANFQVEAESVARLHHANVTQIFEVGEHEGRPYLALEFVTGGTLKGKLNGQPQPVRASAQLVQTLARAMHSAHQRGIVHRDLKPANILLEPHSTPVDMDRRFDAESQESDHLYGVPKVTDFGVAKRMDDFDHYRRGDLVGTPSYMAPEQANGQAEEVGPATDIYGLGAILYEMLTGRPPFAANSVTELLKQVSSVPPTPPRKLRKRLPRDLEAICLKCLNKDPSSRYRSALALANDLKRFLDGEPVRARHRGATARAWRWAVRNPIPSSLLVTATVVLLCGQYSLFHLSRTMVEKTALEAATQQTDLLREMNRLYSDVAASAQGAGVEATHKFPDEEKHNIPIPARFMILLGERMARAADDEDHFAAHSQGFMQMKLYSNYPFRERPDSPPHHHFGKDALAFYEKATDKTVPFYRFEKTGGLQVLRYATPLILVKRCLDCHNNKERYPSLVKTDWKVGDVRGVLEIVSPLNECIEDTRQDLFTTYMFLGILAVTLLATCWIGLVLAKRLL